MGKNIVLDETFGKEVQTDILKTLREYLLKHKLLHNVKMKHINSLKHEGMYIDDMWWYIGKNDIEVLGVINKVVMKYFVKYLHQHKCYKEYYDEDIEDRENEQNEDDEKNDESILSEII